MTHIAEIVTFQLADGVSQQEFVGLTRASESFVGTADGFLHRQLSRGADGRWTDYVVWRDIDAAQAAAAEFPKQDFAAALMGAIKPGSAEMRHEPVLWRMTS